MAETALPARPMLRQIAAQGPAVVAIAHPSKAGADVRGASALPGAVETVITYRTRQALQPGDPITDETEFLLTVRKNRVGDQGATLIRWDGEGGFVAPEAPTDEEVLEADRIVFEIIASRRPAATSVRDIKSLAAFERVANRTVFAALKRLLAAGRIERGGRGEYR